MTSIRAPLQWRDLLAGIARGEGLPVSNSAAYFFAIAIVGAAFVARLAFPAAATGLVFVTFYPAVVLAAILFGAGPGLVAVALSALCARYFFPPIFLDSASSLIVHIVPLGVFSLFGTLVCVLAYQMRRQAAASRASDLRFRLLTSSTFEAIAMTEAGRFVDGNEQLFDLLGYRRDELIGMPVSELLPPDDRARVMENIESGRECRFIEHSMIHKNGRLIRVEAHGQTIRGEGAALRITALRNITEQNRAIQLLRLEHTVASCVAGAQSDSEVLKSVIRAVCETQGWHCGRCFRVDADAGVLRLFESWSVAGAGLEEFIRRSRGITFAPGVGLTGRVWQSGQPLWVADLTKDERVFFREMHHNAITRGAFLFPILVDGEPVGVFGFNSREVREPDERLLQAVSIIGSQVGQFLQSRQAKEQLRIAAIAFESQTGILVTDPNGIIIRVNRAFSQLTGYSAQEAIGRTPALLQSGRNDREFYEQLWQSLTRNGYWQGEMWNRRKDGNLFVEWLTISAVQAPDGTTTHYVGNFSEITKSKEAEAEIHRLAFYDPLTQLPNRRLLMDRLNQALAASQRSKKNGAVLFLDIDHFKNLNDTRGHDVGDRLLVESARRIQDSVREGDTVARLGGDEFVVMLENLDSDAREAAIQAGHLGEKLRLALAQPFDLGERRFHCTASFGISIFCGHKEPIETLLQHADLAMYQAKGGGRNAVRFFDPAMQTALDERSALEADLRLALDRGQLRLYYQPQVDDARRVIGAEALLRWEHPERGLIAPGAFIPLAEETGLIESIGLWVVDTACAQIKAWEHRESTKDLRLAVNVSARQFRQADFVDQVARSLARAGANPMRLKIELTESVVIDNVADTIDRMRALQALGVGFSMDDFGTGFSSLSYLKHLPLDQLKIDYVFIRDLVTDPHDAAIVRTIITMGKTLGLDVIAEGVETKAQYDCLIDFGCTAFQGYLFGRPVPPKEFGLFLGRVHEGFDVAVQI